MAWQCIEWCLNTYDYMPSAQTGLTVVDLAQVHKVVPTCIYRV